MSLEEMQRFTQLMFRRDCTIPETRALLELIIQRPIESEEWVLIRSQGGDL
jgi:hypothetical protein